MPRWSNDIVRHFDYQGPVRLPFPQSLHGVTKTAPMSTSCGSMRRRRPFSRKPRASPSTLNDADAAGVAEMTFGAGRDLASGIVILLTFGTGIGSAIFHDRKLLPRHGIRPRAHAHEGLIAEALLFRPHPQEEDLKWGPWGRASTTTWR